MRAVSCSDIGPQKTVTTRIYSAFGGR